MKRCFLVCLAVVALAGCAAQMNYTPLQGQYPVQIDADHRACQSEGGNIVACMEARGYRYTPPAKANSGDYVGVLGGITDVLNWLPVR